MFKHRTHGYEMLQVWKRDLQTQCIWVTHSWLCGEYCAPLVLIVIQGHLDHDICAAALSKFSKSFAKIISVVFDGRNPYLEPPSASPPNIPNIPASPTITPAVTPIRDRIFRHVLRSDAPGLCGIRFAATGR
jgi:hypothetical protein